MALCAGGAIKNTNPAAVDLLSLYDDDQYTNAKLADPIVPNVTEKFSIDRDDSVLRNETHFFDHPTEFQSSAFQPNPTKPDLSFDSLKVEPSTFSRTTIDSNFSESNPLGAFDSKAFKQAFAFGQPSGKNLLVRWRSFAEFSRTNSNDCFRVSWQSVVVHSIFVEHTSTTEVKRLRRNGKNVCYGETDKMFAINNI